MSGLSDNLKGAGNKLKGEVKDSIGKATDDPMLRAEGKWDKLKGEAQQEVGEIKENLSHRHDDHVEKRDEYLDNRNLDR